MSIEEFNLNKQNIISKVLEQYLGDNPKDGGLVTLFDLIDQVYSDVYPKDKIEELKKDTDFVKDFFIDINGCYSESRVGRLKTNGKALSEDNVPSDFKDIQLDIGSVDNPLLFITEKIPTPTIAITEDGEYTFLAISDLHLDDNCMDSNGNLDEAKLQERIAAFAFFKKHLIDELKANGTPVKGVIIAGDILEAFTRHQTSFVVDNGKRDYLANKVIELAKGQPLPAREENEFTIGILGNHDATMGNDYPSCCQRMQEVVKSLFGKEAQIIGSGYARVKVGDDFVSILHPMATDYPDERISYPVPTPVRDRLEKRVLLVEEYMLLCQKVMADYEADHPGEKAADHFTTYLKQKGKEGEELRREKEKPNLFAVVNEKIKENSALYEFYRPFITCNKDYTDKDCDGSQNVSFFESHMTFDSEGDLQQVSFYRFGDKSYEKIGFNVHGYDSFFKRNDLVKEALHDLNPFVTRNDKYMAALAIVGHHHRLSLNENAELVRVSNAHTGNGDLHVASMEPVAIKEKFQRQSDGSREVTGYTMEATKIKINISEGQIIKIFLQPMQMTINKNPNGVLIAGSSNLAPSQESSFSR